MAVVPGNLEEQRPARGASSSYAIKVLDELRALTGSMDFVFPKQRSDGSTGHRSDSWKPVERLQTASGVSDFTNHAVRKTISTYLTRTLDIPNDVVTAILNHRLSGPKANENYIQALPVRRMREALEAWGRHLGELAARQAPATTESIPSKPRSRREQRGYLHRSEPRHMSTVPGSRLKSRSDSRSR